MNKCNILIVIASSLTLISQATAQLYTQADNKTLSTSEITVSKNRYQTAKVVCLDKARKADVKKPVDVKKIQTNAYVTCMKSKNYNVSTLPAFE